MTGRPRRGADAPARGFWPALVLAVGALAAALLTDGYAAGALQDAGRVSPPGPAGQVPEEIRTGGPVLGRHGDRLDSVALPPRTVVLTFDDGPDPTWTPRVLDVLEKHGVPATFFVLGNQALRHPDVVRRMQAEGHELGNHSFDHPDLALDDPDERSRDLAEAQLAILGAAGGTTPLFRPPYSFSPNSLDDRGWQVVREAHAEGYVTVLADVDSLDWQRPGVDAIVRNATPQDGEGAVILLHDAGGDRAQTVAALDRLVPALKARGYRFTTVGEAVGITTFRPADGAEQWRGRAVITAAGFAGDAVSVMSGVFLVAGVLAVARLLLVLGVARRHVRIRRSRPERPPVTGPVSVVVPAYNEREGIEASVRSIVRNGHPLEVIVVDDGSTDGTADLVEALALPGVRVIRQPNQGKPAALNTGVLAARHDLVVLVDGDTRLETETVARVVQPFADPTVGAVSGNAKVGNRAGLLGRWQHIEYVMGFNLDRRLHDLFRCMATIPGAIGAFRRDVLLDVGGVSDDTLAEDTDLTIAIVRAGWRVVYEETARAWTEAPTTWGQLWKQRYRWCYGTLQAMWKHRRAMVESGASGRFGRRGLIWTALFQVLLPLTAPAMDLFLLYGLLFLDPVRTAAIWGGLLAVQLACAVYAFRLDGERLAPLWTFPLQQVVYRQVMYLVVLRSVFAALAGVRLAWVKLRRTGEVDAPA